MMNSFYGKKISVHISLSSIPVADWSQLDSPTVVVTLVMMSSTKTHTIFPAVFMSASAFMVQAALSLHPCHHQPSCGHGEYFLPASASSVTNTSVFSPLLPLLSSSCACSWSTGSSKLERFLLLTFQSTRLPVLCLGEHWGNRLNNSAFRSLALLRRLMSEDKPCSRAQMG